MTGAGRRAAMRWTAVVTCAAGLVLGVAGGMLGAGAAAPAPSPQAHPALDWLADQMAANGGTIPGFAAGSTDWGLTADAILAFAAAGRSTDAAAVTATDELTAHASEFTTWTTGPDTVRDAGATAKTVLALRSSGRIATAQGVDLEAALRSLLVTSGPRTGRFADLVGDPTWDAANGFAQSLSIMALSLTDAGVPDSAVAYLLLQQCPAGGFRLDLSGPAGCESDSNADTDATALALQALLGVGRTPAVGAALAEGTAWLLGRQGSDGSFGGAGPTAAPNANSTGLAAQYLRAAGLTDAADRAAGWITGCCQLTSPGADGTPAASDVGAIGYNGTARDAALSGGLGTTVDQWRRTTAQAVLALGLSPYGPQDVDPLPPVATTTSTSTSTTSSTSTTTTTTSPAATTSTVPGPTATTDTGPTTSTDPNASPAVEGEQLSSGASGSAGGGSTSGSAVASSGLARTGEDPVLLLGTAVLLIAVGAVLATASRRDPV